MYIKHYEFKFTEYIHNSAIKALLLRTTLSIYDYHSFGYKRLNSPKQNTLFLIFVSSFILIFVHLYLQIIGKE